MQDIFERIDNYRGGEGKVKLKDLVLFLRGVYDNIDENFEVHCSTLLNFLLLFDGAPEMKILCLPDPFDVR